MTTPADIPLNDVDASCARGDQAAHLCVLVSMVWNDVEMKPAQFRTAERPSGKCQTAWLSRVPSGDACFQ